MNDLDHIANGSYNSNTCDLWEEIQSSDLFWNRYTMRIALRMGAIFAANQNDSDRAFKYNNVASILESDLIQSHWDTNLNSLIEDQNRKLDSSVINALIVGYNDYSMNTFLTTNDSKVAQTVSAYNTMFCKEYPLNTTDNNNNIPGIL